MTPDYQLMFLKTERDFAELDRNNLQFKLTEVKRLLNNLCFLQAPDSEITRAKIQISKIEREIWKAVDKLNGLRAQVSEAEAARQA